MYFVKYTESDYADGSGKIAQKWIEFQTLEEANKKVKSFSGSKQYTNIIVLTEVENQLDYKAKFEELYDYFMKQVGVRPDNKPKAVEQSNEAVIRDEKD